MKCQIPDFIMSYSVLLIFVVILIHAAPNLINKFSNEGVEQAGTS